MLTSAPTLIKTGLFTDGSSNPSNLTAVNNTLYFTADDTIHGQELWKSDETGTALVKDIVPGSNGSNLFDLTSINGLLYFAMVQNYSILGPLWNFWQSNGTAAGTSVLQSISSRSLWHIATVGNNLYFVSYFNPTNIYLIEINLDGTGGGIHYLQWQSDQYPPSFGFPSEFTEVNGITYFASNSTNEFSSSSTYGWELWKFDGPGMAILVKDINPGDASSNPSNLTSVDELLYFTADDGIYGQELWKSDGTEAGTVLVKDINPGIDSSDPFTLININGVLYFSADDGSNGQELWKSDGTEAGTVLVKDINPGNNGTSLADLINVNGVLYFTADDGNNGRELWKSDGTEAGTVLVKDINPGSNGTSLADLINVNGVLYFTADDGSNGRELWKSDGTEAGTTLVKDINLGIGGSSIANLLNINDLLYFTADDAIHGQELWKSDGTEAGTILVKDIKPGSNGSGPTALTNVHSTLYFTADDGILGRELWKSDSTETGTGLVQNIGGHFKDFTEVNGILYFTIGNSLWRSDGTEVGTVLVKDAFLDTPSNLTSFNGALYFTANDGSNSSSLWKSDGTAAGTVLLVEDINAENFPSNPSNLVNINGSLYFTANYSTTDRSFHTGIELWKSDGTVAGTVLVKNIQEANLELDLLSSNPANLTDVNGTLYFTAETDRNGRELWKSDGTEAGTVLVKDINPNSSPTFSPFYSIGVGSDPTNLTNVNGTLYFTANEGTTGAELWKSDGTEVGTVLLKDINPGSFGSDPTNLITIGNTLYFLANDGTTGAELWKSDGTEVGTILVKDINPGITGSIPSHLTNVNGTLYFTANDGGYGDELWKSDGTEAGTVLVKDINLGSESSDPDQLVNLNGLLYFTAYDATHGRELWQSDGTEAGTQVIDLVPGSDSSLPANLTNVSGTLFFSAIDPTTQTFSLWKLTPPNGLFQENASDVFNLVSSNSTTTLQVTVNHLINVVSDLGFFTVDDAQGSIDGLLPTDPGYTQAALARARVILSDIANLPNGYAPSNSDLTRLLNLTSNQYLRFYLLNTPTTTTDAQNGLVPNVQFSPVQTITDQGNGQFSLDFQNLSITVAASSESIPLGTNLQGTTGGNVFDLRGVTGQVNAAFTVNREAAYNNFVGFYEVSNAQGDIQLGDGSVVRPGDANYAQVAVQNRVGGINLQVANQGTATFSGQFTGEEILAPFLIINGSAEQFLSGQVTQAFFNYVGANADGVDHVRLLGNNAFGFEDLWGGGDRDFNDVIVRTQLTLA